MWVLATSTRLPVRFLDADHQRRFEEALQMISMEQRPDCEVACALYGLTAWPVLWEQARTFIHPLGSGVAIRFDLLFDARAATSRQILLQWLYNLFGGCWIETSSEFEKKPVALMHLDHQHFQVALWSLFIRRYGIKQVP